MTIKKVWLHDDDNSCYAIASSSGIKKQTANVSFHDGHNTVNFWDIDKDELTRMRDIIDYAIDIVKKSKKREKK